MSGAVIGIVYVACKMAKQLYYDHYPEREAEDERQRAQGKVESTARERCRVKNAVKVLVVSAILAFGIANLWVYISIWMGR